MAEFFPEVHRTLLSAILDRIIPASGEFPGAGALGVTDHLDTVVGQSADLKRLFAQGLTQIVITSQAQYAQEFTDLSDDRKDAVLRGVEEQTPEFFSALVRHTYNGYYSHPTVHQFLGLDPQPPQPKGYQLEPLNPDLLEHVKKRGPLYRHA